MDTMSSGGGFLPLAPLLLLVVIIPVTAVLTVLPFWFICKKAGFHGALSFLMLVPIANTILPFFLAFADWPALRGRTDVEREAVPLQ